MKRLYEHRSTRPLTHVQFARRMAQHGVVAGALIVFSLAIGMWGYGRYENLAWRDSFLNAAMLLGGMGPVNAPQTDAGKVFAGLYALYAGLMFIVTAGIMIAPVVHRILHLFQWES